MVCPTAGSGGLVPTRTTPTRTPTAPPTAPTATRTATAAPTQTATAEPTATATATATTTSAPSGDPAALNAQGFQRSQAGDYAGAIAPLQSAVAACDGGGPLDPCGFAYYNLAVALIRSGRGEEARPLLKERLRTWGDNGSGDVKGALKLAK